MNKTTIKGMKDHARAEYPKEACGLVVVVSGEERYVPCRNAAENPRENFVINRDDQAAAYDMGQVVAVFHSHPDGIDGPSDADRVSCGRENLPWFICRTFKPDDSDKAKAGKLRVLMPEKFVPELLGRPFVHGVLDCYSLVRDWYAVEMSIQLPDFQREDEWWNKNQNLYMDNFESCGFERAKGELQRGDVILMQMRSPVPNHAAIYLGNDQILHHCHRLLSRRDVYSGYFHEITVVVLRRKGAQ